MLRLALDAAMAASEGDSGRERPIEISVSDRRETETTAHSAIPPVAVTASADTASAKRALPSVFTVSVWLAAFSFT